MIEGGGIAKGNMHRIAINFGAGYAPGLNAVVTGATLAARQLGWRVTGIRDGFDGLLFPESYPGGGLVELDTPMTENMGEDLSAALGTASRTDPFHVRTVNAENMIEEVDRSDELFKLHRKGLKTVCVPESVENDVAETLLSYGFNSALSYAVETLDRARLAARSTNGSGWSKCSASTRVGWHYRQEWRFAPMPF